MSNQFIPYNPYQTITSNSKPVSIPRYGEDPRFIQAMQQQQINRDAVVQDSLNFVRDGLVGTAAGVLKVPSDIAQLFDKTKEWGENWENNINEGRDSLQSNKLLDQRAKAQAMLANGASIVEVMEKYPYAASQYAIETGLIPTKLALKAPKLTKSAYLLGKEIQWKRKGVAKDFMPIIMAGTGAKIGITPAHAYVNSIYRDYKEAIGGN